VDELEKLSARLAKVETQYRRFRKFFGICALFAVAGLLMGQRGFIPREQTLTQANRVPPDVVHQEIRSRALILVDEKGNERATLVTDGAGSVFLVMFDANGKNRADLSVSPYGPSLNFYDPSGQARLIAGSTSAVASRVAGADGVVERTPASSLVLFDRSGKLLWRTP
jgi:hypothetical protein